MCCGGAAIRVTGSEYVPRGSPIQLVCNATALGDHRPLDVDWYKDGRLIVSDAQSGLIVTKRTERSTLVSVLAVRHSRMTDAGLYTCRSSDNDVASVVVHVVTGQSARLDINRWSKDFDERPHRRTGRFFAGKR